jgi:hypothetical protein
MMILLLVVLGFDVTRGPRPGGQPVDGLQSILKAKKTYSSDRVVIEFAIRNVSGRPVTFIDGDYDLTYPVAGHVGRIHVVQLRGLPPLGEGARFA